MDVDTAMKTALFHAPSDRRTEPPSLSPSPLCLHYAILSPRGRSLSGRTASRRHARGCRGLAVPSGGVRWTRSAACVCTGVGEQGRARCDARRPVRLMLRRVTIPLCISCVRSSSIGALTSQQQTMHYTFCAECPLPAKALFCSALVAKPTDAVHETGEQEMSTTPRLGVCVYIYIYMHMHMAAALGFLETDLDMMIDVTSQTLTNP
ncbi:hypothetical protein ECC02_013654 [Trypanosoma cruzi]|uniref:Uncharacterized protein n=1 Tax=Trypanosoma cruzi TaxID=5693 RepID=A0A7J6XGU0_TRYCR|nr:hypothetical protein ECC02_013654 [Trypanosoma cruzi]